MRLILLIIGFLSILNFDLSAQDKIFEKLKNKTWFDKTGFAGESIVFIKSDSGQIEAIRQINGSGVPVLLTEIHIVEIHYDTIYLVNRLNEQTKEKSKTIFYTYNYQQELLSNSNGKKLRILFEEPIIYVLTENRNIIDTRVNVNTLTKISFEQNEVYINDKAFKINRAD
jgi:hypothetical protein